MVTGANGGSKIISTTAQIIIRGLLLRQDVARAGMSCQTKYRFASSKINLNREEDMKMK